MATIGRYLRSPPAAWDEASLWALGPKIGHKTATGYKSYIKMLLELVNCLTQTVSYLSNILLIACFVASRAFLYYSFKRPPPLSLVTMRVPS